MNMDMDMDICNFMNKKIILRTDFNVPISKNKIDSTKRIDASLETMQYILNKNPKQLIIISHLGRPNGIDNNLSLEPVRKYLVKILNKEVDLCYLHKIKENKNRIVLLENIRFYPEETEILDTTNNFRKLLTSIGDVFINDAFGCCHRKHSSIVGINTPYKFPGLLLNKEINYLSKSLLGKEKKTLILGGSKISDKIKLIENLIPKIDNILIGGGMSFTFLKSKGIKIGKSLLEKDYINKIPKLLELAKKYNTNIYLPLDFKCNTEFKNEGNIKTFDIYQGIPENYMGLDIGYKTIELFKSVLGDTTTKKLIICNGPLGVFEYDNFSNGSKNILEYIAKLENASKIIGGGDIVSCCEKFKLDKYYDHISTGGGASLELLEGKILPGVEFIGICL